jgi:hypothetical protein
VYVIFDPAQPGVVLATAGTLNSIAMLWVARCEPGLAVSVNQGGLSRGLSEMEQRGIDERVRALRSGG